MKIAVVGVGQSLRGDDGAGPAAVRQWQNQYPETAGRPEIHIETDELPGLALIDLIQENDAVVLVDAMRSSDKAGTIHLVEADELSAFSSDSQSAHGWGVSETIQLAHQLNPALKNHPIKLIGIEAGAMKMGDSLSIAVQEALPLASHMIQAEIKKLL